MSLLQGKRGLTVPGRSGCRVCETSLVPYWPQLRRCLLFRARTQASPSKEIPGLISFRMDWLDLLAVQGTLKSLFYGITGNGGAEASKAQVRSHTLCSLIVQGQ